MSASTKVTKKQLLKLIDDLEASPNDKGRILGDVGITLVGAGLGVAAAGTLATAAGVTSIFGVTSIASWLGLTVVAATPVGWVFGAAAAAGAATYTVSRLIRDGGISEGKKAELLNRYREESRSLAAKEAAGNIDESDRTRFIVALRDLIDKDVIPPDVAFKFIEQVEAGHVPISHGFKMVQNLLEETSLIENHAVLAQELSSESVVNESKPGEPERSVNLVDPQGDTPRGIGFANLGSVVAAHLSGVTRTISDAGFDFLARVEPSITSVSSAAASAASSAGVAAGELRTRLGGWFEKSTSLVYATNSADLAATPSLDVEQLARDSAPVIWLLGKTGSGKSSIIATLTGATHAEVGNGYVSCTQTSCLFDFPNQAPLLRFLDTRGLGEPGYDPAEDLAWSRAQSHLVLVVLKAGDPSQEEVIGVLQSIRQVQPDWPILVVQTGLHDLYPTGQRNHPSIYPFAESNAFNASSDIPRQLLNALNYQRALFGKLNGTPPLFVAVDFTQEQDGFMPNDYGKSALIDAILEVAPEGVKRLVRMKLEQEQLGISDKRIQALNMRILYWAAGAAAIGAAPVVGIVTVPLTQAAMLSQLATVYGVDWSSKDIGTLVTMLGAATVVNQGGLLLLRQIAKIGPWVIPIAAAQDYALTYGLGRAACVYLQARQNNTEADANQVQAAFQDGLRQAFRASATKAIL